MKLAVVTLFPEMFDAFLRCGVTGRAARNGLLALDVVNPRTFSSDKYRSVDDRPYGGGPGMLLSVEPLRSAIRAAKARLRRPTVVYLSPQGKRMAQPALGEAARAGDYVLVCGRYEGIDERVVETEVDEEWSIGDYVLSGGELAAMVVIDALTRLLPGALGHADSASADSFAGGLLDCEHYTRPEEIDGLRVPEVLLTGDHEAIRRWRLKRSLGRTWLRRPDLLETARLDGEQRSLLDEFVREYNQTTA